MALVGDETGLLKYIVRDAVDAVSNSQDRAAAVNVLCCVDDGGALAGLDNGAVLRWTADGGVTEAVAPTGAHLRGVGALPENRVVTCSDAGVMGIHVKGEGEGDCDEITVASNATCCAMLGTSAVVAGKDVEVRLWDLQERACVFTAKNVAKDKLDVAVPVWNTSVCWLAPHLICAGTAFNRLRVYDVRAQRKPVQDWSLQTIARGPTGTLAPNRTVTALHGGGGGGDDEAVVVVADSMGSVRKIDVRTGKSPGSFAGAVGSVRGVHVRDGVVATCGLDRYLRLYSLATTAVQSKVYCKQRLNAVVLVGVPAVQAREDDEDDHWFAEDVDEPARKQARRALT